MKYLVFPHKEKGQDLEVISPFSWSMSVGMKRESGEKSMFGFMRNFVLSLLGHLRAAFFAMLWGLFGK